MVRNRAVGFGNEAETTFCNNEKFGIWRSFDVDVEFVEQCDCVCCEATAVRLPLLCSGGIVCLLVGVCGFPRAFPRWLSGLQLQPTVSYCAGGLFFVPGSSVHCH